MYLFKLLFFLDSSILDVNKTIDSSSKAYSKIAVAFLVFSVSAFHSFNLLPYFFISPIFKGLGVLGDLIAPLIAFKFTAFAICIASYL